MLSFDRETLTIVATVYIYKEFSKAKDDIEGIKGFCNKLVQAHTPPQPRPTTSKTIAVEEEDGDEPTPVTAESGEN